MLQRIALLCFVLAFLVTGCASLSKEECSRANWDALGYRDGSRGKLASRFNAYQKECAEHGFDADFALYKDGHQRGLNEVFCKPRNGYRLGLRGEGYNNVCPSSLEQEFLPAYHYGRDIYNTQRSYNSLRPKVANLKSQLSSVEERIADLRQEIKTDELNSPYMSAQDLRKERGEAAALYDRIKITRPRGKQINLFTGHLRRELDEQSHRNERYIARLVSSSDLLNSERRAIRRIVSLSIDKGQLESEANWVKSNPKHARPRKRQTVRLQRQLRELNVTISREKKKLYQHPFKIRVKRDLEHCFRQAEYEGELLHHRETISYLRDAYAKTLLIDIHFDAEIANLNQRIDFARHHAPSKEVLDARKRRRSELRDAQRQRLDYRSRIAGLENEMRDLLSKIEQMKSSSRYQ